MGRVDTKGWVGKGLGLAGGIAGGALGGPAGAMAGGAVGGTLGGLVDQATAQPTSPVIQSYAAENAVQRMRTAGMFGGPRVRPIPDGAMKRPEVATAQAALSNQSADAPAQPQQTLAAGVSMAPARTV